MFYSIDNFINKIPKSISTQILLYLYDGDIICKIAAINGNLEILKLCVILYNPENYSIDPFHLLQYSNTIYYPLNENVFAYAAHSRHFHIIQYLFYIKCPYDCITVAIFAKNKDLYFLKNIISNNNKYICPSYDYDTNIINKFINNFIGIDYFENYLDYRDIKKGIYDFFINYPLINNLTKDNEIKTNIIGTLYMKNKYNETIITTAAIMSGSLITLKFLCSNKYKISENGLYEAAKRNYFFIIEWLYDNGYYNELYDTTNDLYIHNGINSTILGAEESENYYIIDWLYFKKNNDKLKNKCTK